MSVKEALLSGIEKTDAEILLSFLLHKDRTWILAHPEYELSVQETKEWQGILERRKKGEPVAYITGEKEFYGRSFIVNSSVLIPRPATEQLIDVTLKILNGETVPAIVEADSDIVIASNVKDISDVKYLVDIGTGSGCIAVTLALECPQKKMIATDISANALLVAQKNAERYNVSERIIFREGDTLDAIADISEPFLIISNPPYIPSEMQLMDDVQKYEPHSALFSGEQGTDVISKLTKQCMENPLCRGIIVECRREQTNAITGY